METTSPNRPFMENLGCLFTAIGRTQDAERAFHMLKALDTRILPSFPNYVNSVWNMEVGMRTASRYREFGHLDTEQFQETVTTLDRSRKIAHDSMISSCSQLNRFCDICEIPRFCPDLEADADGQEWLHRKNCAEFCGDVVLEVFEGRDGTQLSEERLAKIESRTLNHGTPDFDDAVESAGKSKGLDPVQMRIAQIVEAAGIDGDADDKEDAHVLDTP